MKISPIPYNESERLEALHLYKILDTDAETGFNDIVELVSQICETPFSLITLIDENRQWFKAKKGIDLTETHRDISFCAHAIHEPDIMLLPDTSKDDRFFDNPFVEGEPKIRFYAGMPLITEEGNALGTLCVLDQKPRILTDKQIFSLRILAKQVITLLQLRVKISGFESQLSAYFKSTSNAVCFIGPDQKIVAFNKIFEKNTLLQLNSEVNIGDSMLDFISAPNIESYKLNFNLSIAGEETQVEMLVPFQNESIWWSVTYIPVRNTSGEIIGVVFNAADIDKRKKAEKALLESEAILRQKNELLQSMLESPKGVIIFSLDTEYCYKAFTISHKETIKKIWGIDIEIGMNMLQIIDDDVNRKKAKINFEKALKGEYLNFISEYNDESKGHFFWENRYSPVYAENGEIVGLTVFSTDITQNKIAENKIQRNVEQKQYIAQLSEAVERTEKIEEIYELALNALQKTIGANMASILLFDADGVIRFKAFHGLSNDYLRKAEGHSPWKENEVDPLPIFIADAAKDESLESLLPVIQKEGISALGFIPLFYRNRLIGKFMIYFSEVHEFSEEEIQLAQTISSLVSHAIGQKKSELELRESEKKYRDVVNNLKEIIFKTDVNGRITFLNPVWTEITGFAVEESIGKYLVDFVHPDDHTKSVEKYNALINFETDHCRHDLRHITKSGNIRWLEINKRLLLDDNGISTGTTGVLNDITEHKKAEKELAENQRFLQTLINNLPGYVYRVKNDPTYTPEYMSEGVLKITGHSADEYIVQRNISGAHSIADVDKERIWNEVQNAIAKRLPYEFSYRMRSTTGDEKWVWERGQGIWNDKGELIATEGFITDISDKKKAEDALQKSEDNLRTVFGNTEVGYALLSSKLELLSFNQPASDFALKEYGHKFIAGTPMLNYFPKERHAFLLTSWNKVFNGERVEYDTNFINTNGEEKWNHIKFSPVSNKEKAVTGIVMSLEDITERKKAEIELNKSFNLVNGQNKRLLNFSYIVSHNLRSHATNIKSILSLMEDAVSEKDRKQMMQHLKTVSNSLDETLHNLYEVISIQNNVNLVFEPLNLHEYIQKAITLLVEQVVEKKAIIKNNVPKETLVKYNPAYLESIILNFLSNAVKYSHPERTPIISLDCFYENNKPVLSITDNGIGIDLKRNGDKLFGMYKTFHGNPDARGIGLFITKSQIEFMGGHVEAESELNMGSTFKIFF